MGKPAGVIKSFRVLPGTYSSTKKSVPLSVGDVVQSNDVRMIQRRGCTRLLEEPAFAAWVRNGLGPQDLNSDRPAQSSVESEENLSHSAASNRSFDPVRSQLRSRRRVWAGRLFDEIPGRIPHRLIQEVCRTRLFTK